ncbi:MAG: MerC domain-containing protein, partial [Pirellulales bacterium]|nr:MerC domain-containing protein [Pirellulales bacterium]
MTRDHAAIGSSSSHPSPLVGDSRIGAWSDWLGTAAAIGCAIHCAAMPLVIAYLPAWGLTFLADEGFHQWMAVGCFAIAVCAFVPGFRKHGRLTPVITGGVGLAMISIAAFGFAGECCASCETTTSQVASAESTCTSTGCSSCPSESDAVSIGGSNDSLQSVAPAPANSPPWLGLLVLWLTPLGGFVL